MSEQTKRGMGIFERYWTLWVLLCIGAGIVLGKIAPNIAASLRCHLDSIYRLEQLMVQVRWFWLMV